MDTLAYFSIFYHKILYYTINMTHITSKDLMSEEEI